MQEISLSNGAECYQIVDSSGAEVVLARHGGHLISWKTACGTERVFLSDRAEFKTGTAIRGGVPIIFPQFNENGPFGRHGFARKSEWLPDRENEVLRLRSSEETLAIWPFEFELTLGVVLSDFALEIEFSVTNTGDVPFSFQAALHSYFQVADVEALVVEGLEGLEFKNEVKKVTEASESAGIKFGTEIDRSYLGVGERTVEIREDGKRDVLKIKSTNFPDFVIWNPGPNHSIGDLPKEGWKKFVCVESAQVQLGEPLLPDQKWIGKQSILVEV